MAIRVLHITPHMGGGVGRVLKHFTTASRNDGCFTHEIACLDYANEHAVAWSHRQAIAVFGGVSQKTEFLASRICAADIVHVHWWNHPLLYEFLECSRWPACRSVIWTHVNGYYPPHLLWDGVLDYADLLVCGTPYTRQVPAVAARPASWQDAKIRTVFASAGYEHVEHVQPRPHRGFHVGYIGTVDYCKMHRDYIEMHAAANIPEATFIVCGGMRETELRHEATARGIAHRFDIRGHITDVADVLATLDVFGYPLHRRHYGASEMALVEAMVAGVVPVVLNNGCESHIVRHGQTGLTVDTPDEYARALEFLHQHPAERRRMSEAAQADARDRFPVARTVERWHAIYDEVMDFPKARRALRYPEGKDKSVSSGVTRFLAALGCTSEARLFRSALHDDVRPSLLERLGKLDPVLRGGSNGSIFHYRKFFPQDDGLRRLADLVSAGINLTREETSTPLVFPAYHPQPMAGTSAVSVPWSEPSSPSAVGEMI